MTTATAPDTCFECGQRGHWASACPKLQCIRCGLALHLHTEAGITECAWRGYPCVTCGFPPHPPAVRMCREYEHPSDTQREREIRGRTAWHRRADPDTFYRRPGRRPPALRLDPAGDLGLWRAAAEKLMQAAARTDRAERAKRRDMPALADLALEQVAESRASRLV